MSQKRKLRIVEVKNGRLPDGIRGQDLTGPIVLMTDGKLPEGFSEEYLIKINATVLSVRSGDQLPNIITQSQKQQFLQWGISEEKLEKAGFIIVEDKVIERGKDEISRIVIEKARVLYDVVEHGLVQLRESGKDKERLGILQEIKDGLERFLNMQKGGNET